VLKLNLAAPAGPSTRTASAAAAAGPPFGGGVAGEVAAASASTSHDSHEPIGLAVHASARRPWDRVVLFRANCPASRLAMELELDSPK